MKVLLVLILTLAGCAATPPEFFHEHTAQYQCPDDLQLVCVRPGSKLICDCRR